MKDRFHDRAARFAAAATLGAAMAVGVGCGDGSSFEVAPSSEDGDAPAETTRELDAAPDTERDAATPDASRETEAEASTDARAEIETTADAEPETETDADADADAESGAEAEAEADAACAMPVFCYPDSDGDGYVASAGAFAACGACPSGSRAVDPTSAKLDCDDGDPSVHPGVTAFSFTPYCVPGTACSVKSFDYDCDGVERMEWTTIASACATAGSGCVGDGWTGTKSPTCGASAAWLTCTRDLLACKASTAPRTQACR